MLYIGIQAKIQKIIIIFILLFFYLIFLWVRVAQT